MAMKTPEKQILPIAPSYPDLNAITKWAGDLTRTLQQNLATIARKANDADTVPLTGNLDASGFDITNIGNLGNISGTITYKGADIDTRYVNVPGDTMTGDLQINKASASVASYTLVNTNTAAAFSIGTAANTLLSFETGDTFFLATDTRANIAAKTFAGTSVWQVDSSGVVTQKAGGRLIVVHGAAASAMANATGTLGMVEVQAPGVPTGFGAFMAFHRPGVFATYFGIDSDNFLKVGGWSLGANAYKIMHEGLASGTFTGTYTFSQGLSVDANFGILFNGSDPEFFADSGDGFRFRRASNIFDFIIGNSIINFVDASGLNGPVGTTTPNTGSFTSLAANINPATSPTLNAAGNAQAVASGAEIVLSNHSGLAVIIDHTTGVGTAVLLHGGIVTILGGSAVYVNSSTPSAAQTGIYFGTSRYRIKNGFAASHTYGVQWLTARNSV